MEKRLLEALTPKKLYATLAILFALSCFPSGSAVLQAQSISQTVVGSAGTYKATAGGSMAWTVGEVITDTYTSPVNALTQGFHQPDEKGKPLVSVLFIPEGFSPNGDEINDVFFIRGLDLYPHNSIVIFNRWGNKVFEASPYKNTWDGTCHFGLTIGGDALPVGTYFYLFNPGDGSDILKGTIYLNR
ncbi:MAG TPA: gliding motility-associated C-terminal domain-containing protein [Bacteroidia bacterium]|jgi:gliding motility-associated-like protein|nr:gliding motility-associated C-terminal domain-containing protein [Bacteroidia bacterium]